MKKRWLTQWKNSSSFKLSLNDNNKFERKNLNVFDKQYVQFSNWYI